LVKEQIPNIRFLVVGRNPPPEVQALQSEHVIVTGTVPDVTPYYQQSHVAVVPLRAGGGTRLKIPEAMALGRPVVSTSVGCEGIDAQSGKHLLLRDDPRQFAEAIIALLNDCDLYANIRRAGRELVVSRYDWDAIAERTLKIYAELLPA
jgi:glycosyltransferase involved in cell wall biosynthesis